MTGRGQRYLRPLGGGVPGAGRRDRDGLPDLLASIGDVAHPSWRARAVGVYRLWRDLGFAVGALLTGLLADAFGIREAIWAVALLTAASGIVVALSIYDTHRPATADIRES